MPALYRDDDDNMAGYISAGFNRTATAQEREFRSVIVLAYRVLINELIDTLPECHERDVAIDRLRESEMWSEAALRGPRVPTGDTTAE